MPISNLVRSFVLTAPLLLAIGRAQEAPPIVQKGTFFEVHCHGGDQALAARALAVVEPVWGQVAKMAGKPDARPKKPLPVHLYRTIAGYEAAELRLTKGKFARNLAMTHHASESAHVALQPPCSDETLRALGVPVLTLELLAWEATHLARRSLLGTQGQHPMWLIDGLAAHVGRASARQLSAAAEKASDAGWPTRDTAVVLVQQLANKQKLPPASAILADRIDELDMHDRYAARAVFFEMLRDAGHEKALAKVLGAVRSTGGGQDYLERVLTSARTALGKGLDAEFTAYVAGCRAQWSETFRSLAPCEDGLQQIAWPDVNAIAWHQQPIAGGAVRIAGQLRILPGDGRQLNVLFGRTDADDFFSVAFVADQGFTAFAYRSKGNEWQRVGSGNAPSLRLGYTSEFVVTARGTALHVELDGQHWDFELPEKLQDQVFWGLGAQAGLDGAKTGTAGLWSKVTASAPQ
jgi:hypothetical protein